MGYIILLIIGFVLLLALIYGLFIDDWDDIHLPSFRRMTEHWTDRDLRRKK